MNEETITRTDINGKEYESNFTQQDAEKLMTKAILLNVERREKEEENKTPYFIFEKEGQAREFLKQQPIFYDKAGLWWVWNLEMSMWEISDEVDILNRIRNTIGINTINAKERNEIINALKQIGRENAPEVVTKNWIQFKNKIVDVETGEIFDAIPKYFMTNPIPHNIGESEETPTLDKYFGEWVIEEGLQDESYINTLYEILAYSCLQKQFLQRMFAFVGSGSNGKGVFLSILKKFLGKDNICSTELKLLSSNQFESSSLYKKQACFMGEVDSADMQNTNLIKKLSGEDDIRYCFKGKTPFTEQSSTTCFMNTNSLPVSPDKSIGFYRRWLIIDFPHEFPVGKDIISSIPDIEFENLAKKVIRIVSELIQRKAFTNEGDIEIRRKKYEDRSSPLMSFVKEYCVEDLEAYIPFKKFLPYFLDYLKSKKLRPFTPKNTSKMLKEEGFEVNKSTRDGISTTYVFGITLKNTSNTPNTNNDC